LRNRKEKKTKLRRGESPLGIKDLDKRKFSTSVKVMKKDENVKIILNNSNSLINRDNGIYKIYDNLFLNKNFIINLIDILKDLYDNNEFTIFNLHF